MIRIGPGLYVFGVAALAACGNGKDSDSVSIGTVPTGWTGTTSVGTSVGTSFVVTPAWMDDGAVPTDSDGDGVLDSGCDDTLNIQITDPLGLTDWSFGMVESGANGWSGEDCQAQVLQEWMLDLHQRYILNGVARWTTPSMLATP